MGARAVMESRLAWVLADFGVDYDYVGRPNRASPGEGYPPAHKAEQARILREALDAGGQGGEAVSSNGAEASSGANGAGGEAPASPSEAPTQA